MAQSRIPIKRLWEQSWPFLVSGLGAYASFKYGLITSDRLDGILAPTISVSAILMGFLGTSKAILLSFNSRRLSWLKKKPAMWKLLVRYFRISFTSNFFLCLYTLTLLGGLSKIETLSGYIEGFKACWVFLILLSISTFYRVIDIFFVLLESE